MNLVFHIPEDGSEKVYIYSLLLLSVKQEQDLYER